MPAREMRMEMFLRALMKRDFSRAKAHMEKLQKMAGAEEWGRGYSKAVNGFLTAVKDNDPDSLIVRVLQEGKREKVEELMEEFRRTILEHEFRDEYEKGYYTAWIELLQAYLNQRTLA